MPYFLHRYKWRNPNGDRFIAHKKKKTTPLVLTGMPRAAGADQPGKHPNHSATWNAEQDVFVCSNEELSEVSEKQEHCKKKQKRIVSSNRNVPDPRHPIVTPSA